MQDTDLIILHWRPVIGSLKRDFVGLKYGNVRYRLCFDLLLTGPLLSLDMGISCLLLSHNYTCIQHGLENHFNTIYLR